VHGVRREDEADEQAEPAPAAPHAVPGARRRLGRRARHQRVQHGVGEMERGGARLALEPDLQAKAEHLPRESSRANRPCAVRSGGSEAAAP
jgi:hypothetical protein